MFGRATITRLEFHQVLVSIGYRAALIAYDRFSRCNTMLACDEQIDTQTDQIAIHRVTVT